MGWTSHLQSPPPPHPPASHTLPPAGKRAGLVCSLLGECAAAANTSSCDLSSTTAAGVTVVPAGSLGLCTIQGTTGGSAVQQPVSSSSANVVDAKPCQTNADCDSADLMCNMATPTSSCTCSTSNGLDTCQKYGQCMPTPCARCNTCMSWARGFASSNTAETSPTTLAASFVKGCRDQGNSAAACNAAQAEILGSRDGAAAKRPALMCATLGLCTAALGDTCTVKAEGTSPAALVSQLSMCTMDGRAAGPRVPGISEAVTLAAGQCFNTSGCDTSTGQRCSMASGQRVCTCSGGVDTCVQVGTCAATSCGTCRACVNATAPFALDVTKESSVSNLVNNWSTFCSGVLRRSSALCQKVAAAISASNAGNLGKRAGAICAALGGRLAHARGLC